MLGLYTVLLEIFCVIILAGPPVTSAAGTARILAGTFAAMAMGMQAVIVRLLMRGVPQTNVMTGNLLRSASKRPTLCPHGSSGGLQGHRHHRRELAAGSSLYSPSRSAFAGAACGAASYAKAGLAGAPIAVAMRCRACAMDGGAKVSFNRFRGLRHAGRDQ